MSLEYICNYYRVPAEMGRRVRYTGGRTPREGTVTGAQGAHVLIKLDGDPLAMPHHPTWELTYLDLEGGDA